MSSALQRACATRKTGTITSGVQTYKIRSRQLSRIHKLGFRAAASPAGTVCGRENAVTYCMPLGELSFSQTDRKIKPDPQDKSRASRRLPTFENAVFAGIAYGCTDYIKESRLIDPSDRHAQSRTPLGIAYAQAARSMPGIQLRQEQCLWPHCPNTGEAPQERHVQRS